eukprot:TRINITY_DN3195_c0_g1_i1.p1 TRINITY_DN3195_c0_g1~~TRINITY_DN3195_c0_g1_i1.p1  ORF type:complete len:324 (+),score=72.67 TRINITY_DN3195_c0_g1_i1:50-973(+)
MDDETVRTLVDDVMCCLACVAVVTAIPTKVTGEHGKGLAALLGLVGAMVGAWRNHGEWLQWAVNPWGMKVWEWGLCYLAKVVSIRVMDWGIQWGTAKWYENQRLKYRVVNKVKGDNPLEGVDYMYLFLNSFVETGFLMHLSEFFFNSSALTWRYEETTFLSTLPALWLLLFLNDLLYAPLHLIMHYPPLYPFIHKHHHRSSLPSRYYLDAGNDHPLEQIGGLLCMWFAMLLTAATTGLHVVTLAAFFTIYLLVQICNHSPYDVRANILGIAYESGLHEMHHRIPSCNMAQYCMTFDKLIGTYRPYAY